MIKILHATLITPYEIQLDFSDETRGIWNAETLLKERKGTLLEPLRDADYFQRFFIDAGALCWPNGLEFSPERLYEQCIFIREVA
ncbi:DUF2442 domain-containing protein [Candidatus Methylobacter oryzae]|uniref:DUF2442 domain-containing protein n=1 Tax=Candidatus Methylobacter oryzae TaxID=2497749 RepID=A0ABY3CEI6_9GAMM|nr:DUF2442 domain-containing protein [Candidatus Methylobacter oryzae]TRX01600.1 DUF2442 domain-containing protein [Candidatus Methylobacter oryzae]